MSGLAEASAFAPGKLILVGEHAVVHGYPAVALAVRRGTRVRALRRPGRSGLDRSAVLGEDGVISPFPEDARLGPALEAVLPAEGVGLEARSDLPVGRGMGSSASLAVAVVRALARLEGGEADEATCIARGFAIERVFHGTPSGLDHTVSARGGAIRYRRGEDGLELRALALPALPLVVLDSGRAGDTAALVASVRARRPEVNPALSAIGALVDALCGALAQAEPDLELVGSLLTENHRLLGQIGVSTGELDALVELALGAGALGAKLSGAGGGGVVIALAPDPDPLLRAARRAGVPAFSVLPAPPSWEPTEP